MSFIKIRTFIFKISVWLLIGSWKLACVEGPATKSPIVGVSSATVNTSFESSPSTSTSIVVWPHWVHVPQWVRLNTKQIPSSHFFEKYDAEIWVNQVAATLYTQIAPSIHFAVGSILVQKLFLRNTREPGPVLAMEKTTTGWSFLVLESNGTIQKQGRIEPCVGCHSYVEKQDSVFGIPLGFLKNTW